MVKSHSSMGCERTAFLLWNSHVQFPCRGERAQQTLTQSVGIRDPDLRVSLGVQLGAGPGKYKSPKIKKSIIHKTREHYRDGTKAKTRVRWTGPQPWGLLFLSWSLTVKPRLLFLITTHYTDSSAHLNSGRTSVRTLTHLRKDGTAHRYQLVLRA